jgi:hypothetical protein
VRVLVAAAVIFGLGLVIGHIPDRGLFLTISSVSTAALVGVVIGIWRKEHGALLRDVFLPQKRVAGVRS